MRVLLICMHCISAIIINDIFYIHAIAKYLDSILYELYIVCSNAIFNSHYINLNMLSPYFAV